MNMGSSVRLVRQKISTTIAPETYDYLDSLVDQKQARTLAEAIDLVVARLALLENQQRLERDTAAYFANLTEEEASEERRLETALSHGAQGIDFDREP
jgi:hypothetical protein